MTRSSQRFALVASVLLACAPTAHRVETTPLLPGESGSSAAVPDAGSPTPSPTPIPSTDPWSLRDDLLTPPAGVGVGAGAGDLTASVALPPIERRRLPNGLEVLLVPDRRLPVVSFHVAVRAGSIDERPALRGLADVVAKVLPHGGSGREGATLAAERTQLSVRLQAGVDLEATHVSCNVAARDAEACLRQLVAAVVDPTLAAPTVDAAIEQTAQAVRARVDANGDALAEAHLTNILYGDAHPRGAPVTEATVRAIGRADVALWHRTWFRPRNSLLVVVGDFDPRELGGRVAKAFAGWEREPNPLAKRSRVRDPLPSARRILLVDRPDYGRPLLLVGQVAGNGGDTDYHATVVLEHLLAGGERSRLVSALGPGAAPSAAFERGMTSGLFRVRASSSAGGLVSTLLTVLDELRRLRATGPTDAEVAEAQRELAGAYPFGLESSTRLAAAIATSELQLLGAAHLADYPSRMAALLPAEVRKAATRRVDPEHAVVVIVGRAAELAPLLEAAGLTIERVSAQAPISQRERAAPGAAVTPAAAARGRALLDRALAAQGGAARVRALRDLTFTGELTVTGAARAARGRYSRLVVPPSRWRARLDLGDTGVLTVAVDGAAAWIAAPGQPARALPDEDAARLGVLLFQEPSLVLTRHLEPGVVVAAAGTQRIAGRDHDVVQLRREDGSFPTRIVLDPDTHLPVRIEGELGGSALTTELFDWRDVGGVKLPHRLHTVELGQLPLDLVFDDVRVDAGVPDDAFRKPE
ncbi:MAG: insulinase family protein [Myxococcales bacterium]|nr:insulinase family protein [Myxococcales bacterium]